MRALQFGETPRFCRVPLLPGSGAHNQETYGSIERINFITEHEDYGHHTSESVLSMVAPLPRDRNGRGYRRTAGESKNK